MICNSILVSGKRLEVEGRSSALGLFYELLRLAFYHIRRA